MALSPTVRTILTVIAAIVAALAVAIPTLGAPVWVGVLLGVVTTGLAALGIVPPQTGGTQQGVASPTVVDDGTARVVQAPITPPDPLH
jgi:hypothetical protein